MVRIKIADLSPRDLVIFKAGLGEGQSYWDSYYGSLEDIVKMLGDAEIDIPDTDGEPLGG